MYVYCSMSGEPLDRGSGWMACGHEVPLRGLGQFSYAAASPSVPLSRIGRGVASRVPSGWTSRGEGRIRRYPSGMIIMVNTQVFSRSVST